MAKRLLNGMRYCEYLFQGNPEQKEQVGILSISRFPLRLLPSHSLPPLSQLCAGKKRLGCTDCYRGLFHVRIPPFTLALAAT